MVKHKRVVEKGVRSIDPTKKEKEYVLLYALYFNVSDIKWTMIGMNFTSELIAICDNKYLVFLN